MKNSFKIQIAILCLILVLANTQAPPPDSNTTTNGTAPPPDNTTNTTNTTNGTAPPPDNTTNTTNTTNGTALPPDNMTNTTNGTAPPPNNTTNTTNGTALPPDNTTNTTNGTAPPPNNTTNTTNGTALPPDNTTNTTNGTAPPPSNITNTTNGTAPPPNNTTNTTNGTAPPPNNTSNTTNGTAPPPSNTTNSTNGTAPPPNNTTNMTNGTNGTSPSQSQVNITFAPPPPLNTSIVGILNNSLNDGRFIGSKRLESLQLNLLPPVGGVSSTNFRLVAFDRNAPNNAQVFQLNQTGNWTVISSTQESLSCSLVLEFNTRTYGFLQFRNNSLQMLYQSNSSLNINNTANIILKQNCFAHVNGNLSFINSTGIFPLPTPPNWSITSTPQSINYGIANNNIYRFNPMSFNFTNMYTLPPYSFYDIRSYEGNIIIAASNISANLSQINQTFYVFSDQNTSLYLIAQFSISGKNLASQPIIPYLTSPQLSKLGVFYVPSNSTNQTAILKSINFKKLTIGNLTFQQPNRILATTMNIPPGNRDFAFGDNYYIIRNGSAVNSSVPNLQVGIEEAYQFVGDQIVFLRNRNLTGKELTDYRRTFVDTYYQNQLVVLDTYVTPSGLEIDEFIYGNLVSINRIVPLTTPPYITFTVPINNFVLVPRNALSWTYVNTAANSTNFTFINANPNFTNNIQIINTNLNGNQTILTMNDKCLILREDASNNISIARFPPMNSSSNSNASNSSNVVLNLQDITQLLAMSNVTLGPNTTWAVSNLCDRFAVNNRLFTRTLNQSIIPVPLPPQVPTSFDQNLTVAVIGNDIWTLSPINNTFVVAFNSTPANPTNGTLNGGNLTNGTNGTNGTNTTNITNANAPLLPPPILPMNRVYSLNNLIVITATNTTTAQVYAYSVSSSGAIKPLLNYYFPSYQGPPNIQVSSNLTKVLIMGPFIPPNQTQVQPKIDAFFIDSANSGFQNISFPFNTIPDPVNSFVVLDEQYLYIRSLASNFSNSPNGTQPQQNIYFINQNVAPQIAYSVNLTQDQVNTFKRAVFSIKSDGSLNNFVEFLNGTQVTVNKIQTSSQQAKLNGNSNILGITAMISDGVIKLCPPGCSDCSTGSCSGCTSSWVFDSSSYSCYRCGVNCASCSGSNTQLCYSCIPGSFLSASSTCLRCEGCKQCSGSATNCSSCPPPKVFLNGTCNNTCRRNCISCSTANDCLTCAKGFVLINGICRGCAVSCSNCSATNITQCTSCAPGLSLVNSTCISCPDKCQTCNNGICATCIPGYTPNSAGTCVLSCAISCATCADNQPTVCLSCYGNAVLSNNQCSANTSCISTSSCTDCGQGLGYVLVGSLCVQCPTISNCLQCSSTNTANCSICMNGYYIDNNYLCLSCSTGCLQCSSGDICTACSIGYTLPENSTQGQCIQCQSPCATCLGVATYCLTCASGFSKRGWKCQNNTYSGFTFTLADTPANVLGNIDTIVSSLLTILNISTTNVDAITFTSIILGSTVVAGTATTTDPTSATTALSTSLSSGSLGTYTVTSSSVTTTGTDSESTSKSNMGLIIGLVIGFIVLVAIVVIVAYFIYQKKKGSKVNEAQNIVIQLQNVQNDSRHKGESKHQSQNFVIRPNTNDVMDKEMF